MRKHKSGSLNNRETLDGNKYVDHIEVIEEKKSPTNKNGNSVSHDSFEKFVNLFDKLSRVLADQFVRWIIIVIIIKYFLDTCW